MHRKHKASALTIATEDSYSVPFGNLRLQNWMREAFLMNWNELDWELEIKEDTGAGSQTGTCVSFLSIRQRATSGLAFWFSSHRTAIGDTNKALFLPDTHPVSLKRSEERDRVLLLAAPSPWRDQLLLSPVHVTGCPIAFSLHRNTTKNESTYQGATSPWCLCPYKF